ncbi:MAG: autotransporter domain-containing protein [Opitutaceae bacterium]|jgi:autotransporter-associated beta strand protein|nr:autotransporter domain-containing protein [Opitutaceae bacterium]
MHNPIPSHNRPARHPQYRRATRACLPGLLALLTLTAAFAPEVSAQRDDNRRLAWTGSFGAEWSGSSWKTSDYYLSKLNATEAQWTGPIPGLGEPSVAFLAGDSVLFDSTGDVVASRVVAIASGGVTASDVVVSGAGDYTFTGGAITADGGALMPTTYQLAGSGVAPGGRLVKTGAGTLTLSNTAANTFKGGILFTEGNLVVTDNRALGDNNLSVIAATTSGATNHLLPGIVTHAGGALLRIGSNTLLNTYLAVAASASGLDITGDIYFGPTAALHIRTEGDTTISGRIYGDQAIPAGASTGAISKSGAGTLTLTGANNWLGGTITGTWNNIAYTGGVVIYEGKVVATTAGALGGNNIAITPDGTLAIQGVRGATYPMSLVGGGRVEVVDSDITFNWRNGSLINVGAANNNDIAHLVVTATSRLAAIASGTLSTVLGGPAVTVTVSDHSALVLGREGITHISINGTNPPIAYRIDAGNIALTDGSALVFLPNTYLKVGGLLTLDADSKIAFAGSGVSRLDYLSGDIPAAAAHLVPDGMTLERRVDTGAGRVDYIVVNQGANPLMDIAMTLASIDAALDTVSARLHENLLQPVARPEGARNWNHAAWSRYFASDFTHDADTAFHPGWDGRLSGLLAGIASTHGQNTQLGLYAGMTESNLTTTNNTSLQSKQRVLGLHAAQRFDWFYAGLHLARVTAHTDSWRRESSTWRSAPLVTHGRWRNAGFTGGGEIGALLEPWKNGYLKPFAGLRYTQIDLTGFTERSNTEHNSNSMEVENFTDTLIQVTGGVQAGQRFKLLGRDAALSLSLAGKHAARSPRETLSATYRGTGCSFTLSRDDYYKDTAAIGLSLRVLLPRRVQAGLDLERETGSKRTRDTLALLLGVTW